MIKKIITYFLSGIVFSGLGFSEDVSGNDLEAAFEKLTIKIGQSSLSGKEVKKLGFADENDDEVDTDYDGFMYTLDFRNRSAVDLNGLRVECRFFYSVDSEWRTAVLNYAGDDRSAHSKTEQKYYEDSLDVSLKSGERYKAETRPFVIESWALRSGYYFSSGTADKVDADPLGLWVRVSIETPSGDTVFQDFYEPDSLPSHVSWDGTSI